VREGIKWSYVDFVDNQETLDLLEGGSGGSAALGVFPLIDEANRIARATYQAGLTDYQSNLRGINTAAAASSSRCDCICRGPVSRERCAWPYHILWLAVPGASVWPLRHATEVGRLRVPARHRAAQS
jgi:hypothetical protein